MVAKIPDISFVLNIRLEPPTNNKYFARPVDDKLLKLPLLPEPLPEATTIVAYEE